MKPWWHGWRLPKRGRWRLELPQLDERGYVNLWSLGLTLKRMFWSIVPLSVILPFVIAGLTIKTAGVPSSLPASTTGPFETVIPATQYGLIADGTTDNATAIAAAITAARTIGGGHVVLPAGRIYTSVTIDLTASNTGQPIWLSGAGTRSTTIIVGVTTTAGINAANSSTRFQVLSDFSLYQLAQATPTVLRAGNYGIRNTSGVGYQLNIERVEVNYFSNSAIFIEGPTGPTNILDCSMQNNYGWGLETALNVSGPQNVNIERGNIQFSRGGIKFSACNGCHVVGTDVELGYGTMQAAFPAAYVTDGSTGCAFVNFTTSIAAGNLAVTPNGVRAIDNGAVGNVFYGGLDICNSTAGINNYFMGGGSGAINNTIIGGQYSNTVAGGAYFADLTGGTASFTIFVNPHLNAASYAANKNVVHDAFTQGNFLFGVASDANSNGFTNLGKLLGSPVIDLQRTLTWAASIAVDSSYSNDQFVTATSNIAATFATPTNAPLAGQAQRMRFVIFNNSGGALTTPIAFSAAYKTSGTVSPANGTRITVEFTYDQVNALWVEQSRSAAV